MLAMNPLAKRNWLIIGTSFLLSLLILGRWVITPAHEKTFGRVWQYYVSWSDFGFHRRGIVGTFLTETGLNTLIANEYYFSFAFYSCLLVLLYGVATLAMAKVPKVQAHWGVMTAFFFSPALFLHFAYSTGNNDIILYILFLGGLFLTKRPMAFGLVLAVGVLVHELFVFMLPAVFLLKLLLTSQTPAVAWTRTDWFKAAGWPIVTLIVVVVWGKVGVPKEIYDALMAVKLPNAAYKHPFWSGHFEVSSPTAANFDDAMSLKGAFWANRGRIILPTLYPIMAAGVAVSWIRRSVAFNTVFFGALIGPLAAQLVAGDYYRWVAMAGCVAMTGVVVVWQTRPTHPKSQWGVWLLLAYGLTAPMGSAGIERPFPLHQYVLEKLFR